MADTTTIDLSPFCDPDNTRYAASKPCLVDGMLYATDCRIAIRCDPALFSGEINVKSELIERNVKFPNVAEVLDKNVGVQEWNQLPTISDCPECGNKFTIRGECDDCCGDGECECDMGHWHDCESCSGTGKCDNPCESCEENVALGNRLMGLNIVRRIIHLPGVVWGTADNDPEGIVFFKFEGGDGAMMPKKQGYDCNV